MKKNLFCAVLSLILVGGVQAEMVTLKYASFLPATTSSNSISMPKVKEKLELESGGSLSMDFYFGGTLGAGAKTQMRLVLNGVADIAEIPVPYNPGRIGGIDVFELPNLAENNTDASLKTLELIENGDITGLDKFVVIGGLQFGPYLIHSKTPIDELSDLEGKRIRVSGAIQSEIMEAFGAVAVANIPATQLGENLNRNLLDGALVDMGNVYNFGIQDEALYHVTNLPLGSFAVLFLMNKKRYNDLDDTQKAAVDTVRGEWFTRLIGADMDAQTEAVLARLQADDRHHLITLPQAEIEQATERLQGVVDKWVGRNARNASLYDKVKLK